MGPEINRFLVREIYWGCRKDGGPTLQVQILRSNAQAHCPILGCGGIPGKGNVVRGSMDIPVKPLQRA